MLSKIKKKTKLIKQIDLFTQPVQLMISRQVGHKTYEGATLSLALLAVITFTFFTNILSLLGNHGNPVTTIQEKYHQAPQLYNLLPSNFTIQLGLQNPSGAGYIDESIYIIEANWVRQSKKYFSFIYSKSQSNVTPIPLIKCDINSFKQKDLQSYFLSQDYKNNYCIDWDQINFLSLEGAWDSDNFQYLAFSLKMCTELTQKKTQCKPLNEVQKLLKHNYFNLQISSNIIDLSDYYNPFKSKGQDSYTTVSSEIYKQLSFYLQPVSTLTDQGMISSQFEYQSTLKVNNPLEMIDLNDGAKILDLIIRLDYVESLNIRIYPKLQQVLAEVGGLWNVLYTVTLFLQMPFKKLAYKLQIMNSLFNYETNDQNNITTMADQLKTRTQLQTDQLDNKNIFLQIPSNRSVQLNPSAKQRLQSIMVKSQRLNDTKHFTTSERKQLSQQISHSIKSFFSTVKKKLKLNFIDYIFFLRFSSEQKKFQFRYSQRKLEKSLDILYIINKLHEIDKLKMILLTQDQIKLFDYLPKPVIKDCYSSQQSLNIYYPLLEPHKSQFQKANEAQSAFSEISKNIDDPINKQLLNCIDQNILEFLKLKFNCEPTINQEQISRSIISQMELAEPLNQ